MKYKCGFCGVVEMPHHCIYSHPLKRLEWQRDQYKAALEEIIRVAENSNARDVTPGLQRIAERAISEVREVS